MTNAAALIFKRDALVEGGPPRRDHELWLAMQAAHDQWTTATGNLDDLVAMASSDLASPDSSLQLAHAAEEERNRFEAYIEARLAFSEFLLTREPAPVKAEPRAFSRRTLLAAAVLIPAIF